jgi:hypothetical protein
MALETESSWPRMQGGCFDTVILILIEWEIKFPFQVKNTGVKIKGRGRSKENIKIF